MTRPLIFLATFLSFFPFFLFFPCIVRCYPVLGSISIDVRGLGLCVQQTVYQGQLAVSGATQVREEVREWTGVADRIPGAVGRFCYTITIDIYGKDGTDRDTGILDFDLFTVLGDRKSRPKELSRRRSLCGLFVDSKVGNWGFIF